MKRLLAIGIILLFIGMSISSSTGFNVEKQSTTPLNGKTLYVGGSGPGNYTMIQDAINDSKNGDTVFVYNGTYYENLNVSKSINLIGEARNTTIIDGLGKENGTLKIVSDNVLVMNFTIQHSFVYISHDAAVLIFETFNVSIINNIINDNSGIGVFVYNSKNNAVTNNTISNSSSCGIEISSGGSYNNIITENTICDNFWGGIELYYTRRNIISKNRIFGNYYNIRIDDSNFNIISNNTIFNANNSIKILDSSSNSIINNTITYNRNGIYLHESDLNNINDNTITSNNDISVYLFYSGGNIIKYNNISDNNAGLYLDYSNGNTINGNNISRNNWEGLSLWFSSSNNTVTMNNIAWNNGEGIDFNESSNNTISKNNFVNNKQQAFFECCKNVWRQNYWNRPRILPKFIYGKIKIGTREIPWFNIDWRPALKPYDI